MVWRVFLSDSLGVQGAAIGVTQISKRCGGIDRFSEEKALAALAAKLDSLPMTLNFFWKWNATFCSVMILT